MRYDQTFNRPLTREEELEQELSGQPLLPAEEVPQTQADQANQIVEADNAPKEEMPPVQEAAKDSANIFDNFVPNEEPTPEPTMQERLWAEYEASKTEAGDRRNQAKMMDAFKQMNRSLAGQAGNKIEKVPSSVSQLPKEQSMAELLAKYKMISGDKDRELKEKKMISDKTKAEAKAAAKPTVIEKELAKADAKESIQIKKENRKMRQEMEKSIPALDEQLKNIKEAKAALKAAKGFAGTGPIDQYASKFTDQGQKLEQALNKISLNTMVKMFSGMSKAIDSDAERAFFQSAQPAMNKYETVNEDILNKMEENVKSLKGKSQEAMKSITPSGEKKEAKQEASMESKAIESKQYSPSRNKTRIRYSDGTEEIVDGKQ